MHASEWGFPFDACNGKLKEIMEGEAQRIE